MGAKATVITRAELEAAIAQLRADQRNAVIQSTRDEYAEDIDALLDLWRQAPA